VKKNDPRIAAFELLTAVFQKRRRFDEALAAQDDLAALDPRDRALARLLTLTVLRRTGELDAMIAPLLHKPLRGKATATQNLLRLGAAQIAFLETPPHAAVSTIVDAAAATRNGPYKKMVNAVLRRLTREGVQTASDPGRLNTPDWLWKSWEKAYGTKTATAIAAAHITEPPLDLTVKRDPAAWAETLGAKVLQTGSLRRTAGGAIRDLPGYDAGDWWVQDAAAAIPARLLGDISGKTVFDLCAAPGGKTAQLAAAGARVTAVDSDEGRLNRVWENLTRLGLDAQLVAADATRWTPPQKADAVLLDAPCSATGTIRRRPDIARLRTPGDVERLAKLQRELLSRAEALLQPGGTLIYATCSLQPEEGRDRITALLEQGAPFDRLPIEKSETPGLESAVTPEGDLRTLPSHWADSGGIDGFYVARLRRL